MPEDLEQLKKGLGDATRALVEARGKMEAAETRATASETRTAAIEGELKEVREAHAKISKEHDEIVTRLQDPNGNLPGAHPDDKKGQEVAKRAYGKFLRNTDADVMRGLSAEEKVHVLTIAEARKENRSLYVSNEELGGVLVNPVISNRMVEQLVQVSPLRSLATVMAIGSGQELKFTRETGQLTAGWTAERATRTETSGNEWKAIAVPTHEQYALVRPTHQLLEDVVFNLEAWLESRVIKQFSRAEGIAFLTGTGIGKPRGLFVHPDVEVLAADASAASGEFIPNDVTDLMAALQTEYALNGTAIFSRLTLAFMRKFVDKNDRRLDLVQPDVLAKIRAFLIDGYPGREMPNMASVGTASASVLGFGDIAEAYTIVDRSLMTVIRDIYSLKTVGEVELMYMRRVGGDVVQPDAFKILQAEA